MIKRLNALLLSALMLAAPAVAEPLRSVVSVELLPGWRKADGTHQAGLAITLAEGWKTYWRAPGDGGIPPVLMIESDESVKMAQALWPTPVIFHTGGMRSVGYDRSLIVPLLVTPNGASTDIDLQGQIQMGVCHDICMPVEVGFSGQLAAFDRRPDARIAAALADRPLSAREARVGAVDCTLRPEKDGVHLTARIEMPTAGSPEESVVEVPDQEIWVMDPTTTRHGGILTIETRMEYFGEGPLMLERSALRFTVLGAARAVDIRGCAG
ncbi:Thiol-disulfide interchange protein, contains DsbC and DsbD domains [Poseidonocella pacifica]|uniref:Thiol-disulfide interchange protein, contains DsbC and DsbD domains n=1 Tax=Poseidonocella pacifica TaxID=871651 RepID=A0A1I0XIE5_9RHOB|nr:protein-disulfide reductase DsbD domain-containing protein [Poseidonocella pacifica]SFA99988.1 Thiol-disulfide interchange protein, contains DsbC and DsbD domains [Poseidonocella pacifica]